MYGQADWTLSVSGGVSSWTGSVLPFFPVICVCVCVCGPTRDLKRTISVERKGNKNNEATAEARIS